jgi:ADP-ribose pyrophosphatase YjhB (NUDIX family)
VIETLLDNEWLSLRVVREPDRGVNGYVFSHESRCAGRIVAVLPYRVVKVPSRAFLGEPPCPDQRCACRTGVQMEYLVKSEMTPCWSLDQVLSAITGGHEGGDIADDAVREMLEETGYEITRDELVPLGESYASKSADTVYTLFGVDLTGKTAGRGARRRLAAGVRVGGRLVHHRAPRPAPRPAAPRHAHAARDPCWAQS